MATVDQANEFLGSIAAGIDLELSAVAPNMTFALVVWVKGRGDDPKAVSLMAHPDHNSEAPTALRTVADAYEASSR